MHLIHFNCVLIDLFLLLKVKNIYIHNEMFSIQNGLLTPTLKAKRPELKEFFKQKIDQLYSSISMWKLQDLISVTLQEICFDQSPANVPHEAKQFCESKRQ